ncbi:COG4280 domain-containing protein [Inquilinus sp. NPDC058860]|uniref:COG4280 domain-containing protein n=1 Tax=Inquilinus sp. NPDC058860 TaxID=3346652 RepID=UPI0036BB204A
MISTTAILSTITASFLGSFVEVVEAFTIILAVGLSQSWRPAFIGTAAALAVLAVLILLLGPLLELVPIEGLQFVIGTLLILFGLRWLRKAILRASGLIPLRDEARTFEAETDQLRRRSSERRADWLAGVAAFKAVLLEGVEVVFIVIAVGAGRGLIGYASLGATAACLLVLVIGLAVHRPLSRVPENTLKFTVGLLLTSFGVFWTGEGLGADWPGADLSLLGILALVAAVSFAAIRLLRPPSGAPARRWRHDCDPGRAGRGARPVHRRRRPGAGGDRFDRRRCRGGPLGRAAANRRRPPDPPRLPADPGREPVAGGLGEAPWREVIETGRSARSCSLGRVDGFEQDEPAVRATKDAKFRFVFSQRKATRLKRLSFPTACSMRARSL